MLEEGDPSEGNNILDSGAGGGQSFDQVEESVARGCHSDQLPLWPSDLLLPHLAWDRRLGHVLDEDGENTWLNGVAPTWEILETLSVPALAHIQAQATEAWERFQADGSDSDAVLAAGLQVASPDIHTSATDDRATSAAITAAFLIS